MPPTRLLSAAAAGTTRCATCVRSTRCLVARLGQTEGGGGIVEFGVSAGEPVLRQGEPVRHVLAAKVGLLTLRRQGPAGPGRAIAVIGPGQTLGLRALVGQDAAPVDAVALTDARVCARAVAPGAVAPAVSAAVLAECVRMAETLADWAAIGRLPLAAQRVEAALRGLAATADTHRVVLPDRDVLAELTACAPETVSRAIATLVRAGRLQRGERRRIVVLPPAGADAALPMPDGGLPVARQDTRAADDAINRRFA